jgi:hypothetical protein
MRSHVSGMESVCWSSEGVSSGEIFVFRLDWRQNQASAYICYFVLCLRLGNGPVEHCARRERYASSTQPAQDQKIPGERLLLCSGELGFGIVERQASLSFVELGNG